MKQKQLLRTAGIVSHLQETRHVQHEHVCALAGKGAARHSRASDSPSSVALKPSREARQPSALARASTGRTSTIKTLALPCPTTHPL